MIKILRKIIDIIFWIAAVLLLTLRDHKWKYDSGVSGGECRVCQWCEPGRAGSRG